MPLRVSVLLGMVFGGLALDAAQERPIRRITIPALVSVVAFSQDGRSLTAWDPAGYSTWQIDSGRVTKREPVFAKACGRTPALPRSEDGITIGVVCQGKVFFFDVATGQSLGEWTAKANRAPVAFSTASDGSLVAVVFAGALGTVEVLSRKSDTPVAMLESSLELERVSLAPGGRLVAAGATGNLSIWQLPDGRAVTTLTGGAAHAFSADGGRIAFVRQRQVAIHDVEAGTISRELEGSATEVRFAADGGHVVGWTNQQVTVWTVSDGTRRFALKSDQFVTAALSADAARLATISLELRGDSSSSTLAIWNVPPRQP